MENGRSRRSLDSNSSNNINTNTNTKLVPTRMKRTTPPATAAAAPPPDPTDTCSSRSSLRKVEIVYYLSRRDGQLEHPHFMELSHLAHRPLRLKDVMERLMLLRGKAMPSLYSWSCKRSYKNGYVWNDLGENDLLYPTQPQSQTSSPEYILKGSQILLLHTSSDKTQQHDVSPRSVAADQCPKLTTQQAKRHPDPHEVVLYREEEENFDDDDDEEEYEGEEDDTNNGEKEKAKQTLTEFNSVVGAESVLSRNSFLLQLIACGGGGFGGGSAADRVTSNSSPAVVTPYRKNDNKLYKGVVCKRATEEEMIIRCMSENPRFGNLQAEEKEYFSGSIVDSMISTEEQRVRSVESAQLKKSSSYNEERSLKSGLGEAQEELQKGPGAGDNKGKKKEKEERKKREKSGKCLPIRMRSSSSSNH